MATFEIAHKHLFYNAADEKIVYTVAKKAMIEESPSIDSYVTIQYFI